MLGAKSDNANSRAYEDLGLSLAPLNDVTRQQLGISKDTDGVVVTNVLPGSAASEQGLRRGDIIKSVNGESVDTLAEIDKTFRTARAEGDNALLLVRSSNGQRFVALGLA